MDYASRNGLRKDCQFRDMTTEIHLLHVEKKSHTICHENKKFQDLLTHTHLQPESVSLSKYHLLKLQLRTPANKVS